MTHAIDVRQRALALLRGCPKPWALALFALIPACHRGSEQPVPLEGGCRSCHGGQSNAAPPGAIDGSEDTHSVGVGAHQAHVLGAALGRPVACSECHVVPRATEDPGHIDTALPAEVVFGALATRAESAPVWDRAAMTCTNAYCHGSTIGGGTNKVPKWNVVDGSQASCGSCHGLPPPLPHPAATTCDACHGPVAGPNLTLAMPLRHADGVLDVGDVNGAQDFSDPAHDLEVQGLIPTYAGTSITTLTPLAQTLKMPMKHDTTQVVAEAMSACTNCHPDAAAGQYLPGQLHVTIDDMGLVQPYTCTDCHAGSRPKGFVGKMATAPARTPPSGEMKHDAVLWVGGAPSGTPAVPADCTPCHAASGASTWASTADQPVTYHAALGTNLQPSSCVDCHANSRPTVLNSGNSAVPAGLEFDHGSPQALEDCQSCHAASAPGFTTWAGGRFHQAGGATPTSCLPCHEGERPTDTNGWVSTTYRNSPFDYGTNSLSITHGAGQDCVGCHNGPGTGQWGSSPNWINGRFDHGPSSLAATLCVNCHTTQRPDLLPGATAQGMATLLGFDHSTSGRGDCLGCHQATVRAGNYVNLYAANGMLPGGDWQGGIGYPGSALVSSTTDFFTATEITLNRGGAANLVTGTSQRTSTYYNSFLHTATVLPPELNAGPTGNPDNNKCWHCHTGSRYSDGVFHDALRNYRATMGGAVTPLAQPTRCTECHNVRPRDIVERAGSSLRPMDHAAAFTTTVNINGVMANDASDLDCAQCHRSAAGSTTWADGQFHNNIGSAVPADCTSCHYPLMADGGQSDVTQTTRYVMKHRSGQITTQSCETCHGMALGRAANTPASASLWNPGVYHGSLNTQPAQCNECHAVSQPSGATQGTMNYMLAQGGTASNQGQWMNHASAQLAGKDCAACHATDAKRTGSAWNKGSKFHGPAAVSTCRECHGLTNGRGTVVGTNNNLPTGFNNTSVITTASPATGVPAGTRDQITHTDINVTGNDCKLCHTQQGPSTVAAIQGKEWAQASFHRNFNASKPLVINGSTGRCSNCHMNVKPGTSYTQQDHSAFTASSAQDCSACHAWPGTSATTPNWLGATGAHASSGPTAGSALACSSCHGQGGSASTRLTVPAANHFGGIGNGNTCLSCHINFSGFKGTITNVKYGHANASANSGGCVTCHSFQNQLLTTLTTTPQLSHPTASGGHQFSQTLSVTGSFDGDRFTGTHTQTGLTRCGACHQYSATTAGTNIWAFKHRPSNAGISNNTRTSGCDMCH